MIGEDTPTILQKENIKLVKNTKGFNWEIKIFLEGDDKTDLVRLQQLNNQMEEQYGNN